MAVLGMSLDEGEVHPLQPADVDRVPLIDVVVEEGILFVEDAEVGRALS